MATITTAGSGNWNSTTNNAPWPSGTVPNLNTDTVVIANGHTVTITDSRALPETTVEGTVSLADAVITATLGGVLTVGNGTGKTGTLTLGAGATLALDASNIVLNNCVVTSTATATAWAHITSNGGSIIPGSVMLEVSTPSPRQNIDIAYVSFVGNGTATVTWCLGYAGTGTSQYSGPHCVYHNWSAVYFGHNVVTRGSIAINTNNSDFREIGALHFRRNGQPQNIQGNQLTQLKKCTFANATTLASINFTRCDYADLTDSIFVNIHLNGGLTTSGGLIADKIFMYSAQAVTKMYQMYNNTLPCFLTNSFIYDNGSNPHSIGWNTAVGKITIANCVLDTNQNANVIASSFALPNIDIYNNLMVRAGVLLTSTVTNGGSNAPTITINNNTCCTNTGTVHQGLVLCETNGDIVDNAILNIYNNLVVCTDSKPANGMISSTGESGSLSAKLYVDMFDYNAWWNYDTVIGDPLQPNGPNVFCAIGEHCLANVNPILPHTDYNLATWGAAEYPAQCPDGTADQAMTVLLLINGYNASSKTQVTADIVNTSVEQLISWVKEGYIPANQLLSGSGYNGADIGAFAVVSSQAPYIIGITPATITTNVASNVTLNGVNFAGVSDGNIAYDSGTVGTILSNDGQTIIVSLMPTSSATGTITVTNSHGSDTISIVSNSPAYTVTFDTAGGSAIAQQTITAGGMALRPANPTKSGNVFVGWYSDAGRTTIYDFATPVSSNLIIYAGWTVATSFTVSYQGNANTGGTVPVDAAYYLFGSVVTVLGNTGSLVNTGYTFSGWNTAADGSGTTYQSGQSFYIGSANVILYAVWVINTYTITFNSNGGSSVSAKTAEYNATITLPTDPIRTGYLFGGWYLDAGLTTQFSVLLPITQNLTLYAKWTVIVGPPTVTDVSPTSVTAGVATMVTVTGTNLTDASVSYGNGTVGTIVVNPTVIYATITGTLVGDSTVVVTTPSGVASRTLTTVPLTIGQFPVSIKYWPGSTVYARVRNLSGNYYAQDTHEWYEGDDTNARVYLDEYSDNDPKESRYTGIVLAPILGGPYIVESLCGNEFIGEEMTTVMVDSSHVADAFLASGTSGYTAGTVGSLINKLNVPENVATPIIPVPVPDAAGTSVIVVDLYDVGLKPEADVLIKIKGSDAMGTAYATGSIVVDLTETSYYTDIDGRCLIHVPNDAMIQIYFSPSKKWSLSINMANYGPVVAFVDLFNGGLI